VIFVAKYISAMVFGGGILGSAHKLWGNLYLNSVTVLFDIYFISWKTVKFEGIWRWWVNLPWWFDMEWPFVDLVVPYQYFQGIMRVFWGRFLVGFLAWKYPSLCGLYLYSNWNMSCCVICIHMSCFRRPSHINMLI